MITTRNAKPMGTATRKFKKPHSYEKPYMHGIVSTAQKASPPVSSSNRAVPTGSPASAALSTTLPAVINPSSGARTYTAMYPIR